MQKKSPVFSLCLRLSLFLFAINSILLSHPVPPLSQGLWGISGVILPVTCIVPLWHRTTLPSFLPFNRVPPYCTTVGMFYIILKMNPLARCPARSAYFCRNISSVLRLRSPLLSRDLRVHLCACVFSLDLCSKIGRVTNGTERRFACEIVITSDNL